MRIQLWSYNYDPEPTGIGPLSTAWAQAMAARGHKVSVIAAHPHYPEPRWGARTTPYREVRADIPVLRLPLWSGRATTVARLRQEASFSAMLAGALPFLGTPDVIVAVSPSFPALAPAMLNARLRRTPWVLWLQDILPDGAAATGILSEGNLVRAARRFERLAYASAQRIVVISDSFAHNLRRKGVPDEQIARIYNPATRPILTEPRRQVAGEAPTVLTMGNVGRSQNLQAVVEAFQSCEALTSLRARLVIAGDGVAGAEVRSAIRTDRVEATGVVDTRTLDAYLRRATIALVSQQYEGIDFNVPSKLMNFMAYGIPTVAAVRQESEVARIVERSGGGWVATSARDSARKMAAVLKGPPAERQRRGEAALHFARQHFTPEGSAAAFDEVLATVCASWQR